jgi:predicted ArsR family transcriptional regulator
MVFRAPSRRPNEALERDVAAVAALDDPVRAAIFSHVTRAGREVSRDQAARAVGVSRRVAAAHLDHLVNGGWLEVSFRRLSGRVGPGAGRTSKLYRRSSQRVDVSLPARNYELLARVMASAVQLDQAAVSRLAHSAGKFGSVMGASAARRVGGSRGRNPVMTALTHQLDELGFEPYLDEERVLRLRNCPFHDMARENSDVVCATNLAFMRGLAGGLGSPVTASLELNPATCCVAFRAPA